MKKSRIEKIKDYLSFNRGFVLFLCFVLIVCLNVYISNINSNYISSNTRTNAVNKIDDSVVVLKIDIQK